MKYYEKKHKQAKRRRHFVFLCFFLVFAILAFVYIRFVVNPIIVESTEQMIFSLSTSAVSDAVYDVLKEENISYSDLVDIEYDNSGNVSMIHLQTVKLNMIARQFYQVAQVYLDKMGRDGIDVPLGAFSGLPFLSGFGPKINVKLVSIGAMTSTFESQFSSAGINQTNHSVFIHLFASVSLILPAYTKTIDSTTEMLVAESVIVGEVPEVYLSGSANFSFGE